ncbi:MAG: MerR family transcriptional regulator [Deltaproteobacteria bacterium]|nr:MerR family transcriptional regulator [Deltaproteobacteria bacterium]
MSHLSRQTGVSPATINFYIREGLLPVPTLKTSRNMAYYDESFLTRIRLIRRLQETKRLSLRVIKSLLANAAPADRGTRSARRVRRAAAGRGAAAGGAGNGGGESDAARLVVELESKILPFLDRPPQNGRLSRDEVLTKTGVSTDDLDALARLNIIEPVRTERAVFYSSEDTAISEVVGRARALGLSRDLFPLEDLALYLEAIGDLVGKEVQLFARRIEGHALSRPPAELVDAAVHVMGDLIARLREKLIRDPIEALDLKPAAPRRATR